MSETDPLLISINQDHPTNHTCRICLEEDRIENMMAPCRCTGHSKYVHTNCLDEWRATAGNQEAFNRCFTCNYTYRTKVVDNLSTCGRLNFGHPKYYCGIYLVNFAAIMIIGYILQEIDITQQIPYFFNHFMDPSRWIASSNLFTSSLSNSTPSTPSSPNTPTPPNTTIPISSANTYDPTISPIFYVFEYLTVASYVYIGILLILFGIKLVRMKNRCIYLKYIIGSPWYYGLFRVCCVIILTLITMLTNPMVGCFVMTCIIQLVVRSHYHYVNEYYRAQSIIIIPYDLRHDPDSYIHPNNQNIDPNNQNITIINV